MDHSIFVFKEPFFDQGKEGIVICHQRAPSQSGIDFDVQLAL